MGLMDIGQNNPYARINPFAAFIDQGLKGYQSEEQRQSDRRKEAIAQAQQEELLGFKRQEAQRLAQQAALEQQASSTLRDRIAATQDRPIQTGLLSMGDLKQQSMLPQAPMQQAVDTSAMRQPVLAGKPMTQQDWLQHAAQYAGTPTATAAMQIGAAMQKEKSPAQQLMENVLKDPSKFDDKTVAVVSQLMGTPVGAYRKPEEAQYKQRDYLKGDKHIYEESSDGGKTWKPLSDANRYKPDSGGNNFRMDDSNRKFAVSLRKEFNQLPDVKESNEVMPKISSMRRAMEEAKKTNNYVAVDQALITLYNKLTDPTSVVRESEYARTAMNLPTMNRLKGAVQKVATGGAGLTSDDRQALMNMAELMNKGYSDIRNRRVQEYSGYAAQSGLDPKTVINDQYRESHVQDKPKPMSELPPASTLKGRTITRNDGIKLISDGTKWNIKR